MLTRAPIAHALDALALHTAGFPALPEITKHERTGEQHVMWYASANPADSTKTPAAAQALLSQFGAKDLKKNLQETQPEHPFIAARHAIETVGALLAWLEDRAGPVAIVRTPGRLLRAVDGGSYPVAQLGRQKYDLLQHCWSGGLRPSFAIHCPYFAAALIVCGFPCAPTLIPPRAGQPGGWGFPDRSLTFPELSVQDCMARFFPDGGAGSGMVGPALPGPWVSGEHPFEYAYAGALNSRGLEPLLHRAGKNPQIFLKGRGSGGVLATQALLERDGPFRRRAHEFLT